MNRTNTFWGLALAFLTAIPQGAAAQQTKVELGSPSKPVSYALHHPEAITATDSQKDPLQGLVKMRSHRRQGGTYTAAPQLSLKQRHTGLNDLLLKHEPMHITADKVRRAVKQKAKAPFKPDNDHRYLITNVIYNTIDETQESGLFALDVTTGELTCLFAGFDDYDNFGFNGGAYVWNGKYRGVFFEQGSMVNSSNPARVMDFNMDDWTFDEDSYIETTIPYQTSMALECATEYNADGTTTVIGQFWGVDRNGNLSLRYATLDPDGRTTTKFGQTPQKHMVAMGVTNDGRLYGVCKDGNLYQIDRATAEEKLIGHTGVYDLIDHEGFFWLQGGEIDPRDNTFYWVVDHAVEEKSELCSVNLETGKATVLVDFDGDIECAGILIAPQQRQDATPAAASNLQAQFAPMQTTGSGSFTAPVNDFGGKPLAADAKLYYNIYVNDVKQAISDNQTTPGATVNFSIAATDVKDNAENTIKVTTSLGTDGEESLSTSATAWVGLGIPEAPKNVALSYDEAEHKVTISWEHPTRGDYAGTKGGKVDYVSYFVYRVIDGDRMADIHGGYPLMDDETSIVYTLTDDDLTMTLADLTFEVEAWASPLGFPLKELASEPASTSALPIGVGKSTPYFVDFANDYYNIRQKDFTIIDGNQDGKTWKWCEPHMLLGQQLCGAVAASNYTTTKTGDEWFITPGIELKAGTTYHFKSNMHGPLSGMYVETLEICLGTAKNKEAMTQVIMEAEEVIDYCDKEFEFTVDKDDTYYVGLHAVSAPSQWEIALFDIYIAEATALQSDWLSLAAGEIEATPVYGITTGADGQVSGKADIVLTLPTETLNGKQLGSTDRIQASLYATGGAEPQLIKSWADQAPGTRLTLTTDDLPTGEYTFTVETSYTADGESHIGQSYAATAHVGWDNAVATPTGMDVVQRDGKLIVRFPEQEQLKGAHGAYLPSVSYRAYTTSKANQLVYYVNMGNTYVYDAIIPDAETDGLELVIPDFNPDEGMQYNWTYFVMAVSKDAQGNKIYSPVTAVNSVIGAPIQAPAIETGNREFILDAALSPDLDEVWRYWLDRATQVAGIQPIADQFGHDVGNSWYVYSAFNGSITALGSKVDISNLSKPVLNLDIILEDTDTDMEVVLNGPNGLKASHKMTVMDGMQHISLPLDEYQSWGWVQPCVKSIFHLTFDGDHYHDIYFDNFGVYDAQPTNMAVVGFEIPKQMNAGEEVMANVSVMNMGQQAVRNYTVTLYEDEAPIASETVSRALQPGDLRVVQFRYRANTINAYDRTGMEDAEKVLVTTVEVDGDAIGTDNSSEAVVTISVNGGKNNSYPSDVVASQASGSKRVNVSWSFDMDKTAQQTTESFEDYELWYTGGVASGAPEGQLGPWRLYDRDNMPTYTWKNMEYLTEYAGQPQAFQVFEGSLFAGMSDYYYYNMKAASGTQYLVSMDPADGNYTPLPDDYLISPEVRGGTVLEFYYGSLLRQTQGCEVLYSETGRDISDFKLLKQLDDATKDEWLLAYVTLPETAKYFAIRHSKGSYLGYGLKIDDITYVKAVTIDHFNVYVDGQLVGTTSDTSYAIDGMMGDGRHRIAVTAVYADGTESVPAYASFTYTDAIRQILATGKPFDVYSLDGKLVRQQTRTVEGLKGTYVVGGTKVILK